MKNIFQSYFLKAKQLCAYVHRFIKWREKELKGGKQRREVFGGKQTREVFGGKQAGEKNGGNGKVFWAVSLFWREYGMSPCVRRTKISISVCVKTFGRMLQNNCFPDFCSTFFYAIFKFARPEHDCFAKFTSCPT